MKKNRINPLFGILHRYSFFTRFKPSHTFWGLVLWVLFLQNHTMEVVDAKYSLHLQQDDLREAVVGPRVYHLLLGCRCKN